VSNLCLKLTVAASALIGIGGDVRSEPPPTDVGSRANITLGAVSGVLVVLTKLDPPLTGVAVQPAGRPGAVTPSKFSENVTFGTPAINVRVKLVAPRLLFTLKITVTRLPQAADGTV
jgi:hypothetical protein